MANSNNNNQSDNGQNDDLARLYGELLEGKLDKSDLNDSLLHALLKARGEHDLEKSKTAVEGKASSWKAIESAMQDSENRSRSDQDKRSNVTPIRSRNRWLKVAAAILLVAFSSLLLLQLFSEPDRVTLAQSGATIQTVDLPDGSSVTLRPNSELIRFTANDNGRAYALNGEAIFDVVTNPDQPFSVEAGIGRVVVTGTRFNVSNRDESAFVYLIEGEVRFETLDRAASVDLDPGQASEIQPDMKIRDPFTIEENLVTGWSQNRLTFRDREAGSIIDELEFHFNIDISAPGDVRNETLGGTIQLDSAQQSLDDLGMVLGGTFDQTGDRTFEYRSD